MRKIKTNIRGLYSQQKEKGEDRKIIEIVVKVKVRIFYWENIRKCIEEPFGKIYWTRTRKVRTCFERDSIQERLRRNEQVSKC